MFKETDIKIPSRIYDDHHLRMYFSGEDYDNLKSLMKKGHGTITVEADSGDHYVAEYKNLTSKGLGISQCIVFRKIRK